MWAEYHSPYIHLSQEKDKPVQFQNLQTIATQHANGVRLRTDNGGVAEETGTVLREQDDGGDD